ncbi:MAG: T9SS type A sorting domain-containing protein [Bacteroidales bacterium]|nr:T9SS type A sorting domain-containing protein [Candidatus Latescibacterota bacterium]
MNRVMRIVLILNLLFIVSIVPSLWADWSNDGVEVTIKPGVQRRCQLTTDGAGGAIIVWEDSTHVYDTYLVRDIYAQRIDLMGNAQWGSYGKAVCTAGGDKERCQIISDLQGGAFIVWEDGRNFASKIYAQRIYGDGTDHWSYNGAPVCTEVSMQSDPQLVLDWVGGVIVVWMDNRHGQGDIYAQRINGSGVPLWRADGDSICIAAGKQEGPQIISDGSGGAIMTWFDQRSGTNDIYAQRVDSNGNILWTFNGVPVCTAANEQNWPCIVSDGAGGAIIAWHDVRNGFQLDIYAQRIDATGAALWTTDGVALCTAIGDQYDTEIVSDGAGGAIVWWIDRRNVVFSDLVAQRIDAAGVVQWNIDGVPICQVFGDYITEPFSKGLVSDGAGGAIATWQDTRGNTIYAQRIDHSGSMQWASNGMPVSTAQSQDMPRITSDGSGGAIIAWEGDRFDEPNIYAQQINAEGRLGLLDPVIHSVSDIYGDEGGFVNLIWDAPRTDFLTGDITEYTIWRALETPAAQSMISRDAVVVSSPSEALDAAWEEREGPILRHAILNGTMFYWELIFTQAAYRLEGYAKAVPTLFDSTAVNDDYHYFQVIAHTSDPSIFYVSEPDSGYSVDDLAPCSPAGFTGTQSFAPEGLWLTWNPNMEGDFDLYNIYRDIGSSFEPGPGNLLLSTCETNTFDAGWNWEAGYCYKIAAVDINGNESEYTSLCEEQVTGDDPVLLPVATFLDQNYPNPFNPSTTISFGLKESGHISLRIYDTSGRLVATLADETRPAGNYTVDWNGRDGQGSSVASGVYFYKLNSKNFEETKKMILLR